jgi:hypothetical protein
MESDIEEQGLTAGDLACKSYLRDLYASAVTESSAIIAESMI